ncbi:MAG: hypothetical protein CL462_07725 [Acidimicrobiaceae bacterium]|nr:hypothetical protein [Acidimicrobiaceae bacterium]
MPKGTGAKALILLAAMTATVSTANRRMNPPRAANIKAPGEIRPAHVSNPAAAMKLAKTNAIPYAPEAAPSVPQIRNEKTSQAGATLIPRQSMSATIFFSGSMLTTMPSWAVPKRSSNFSFIGPPVRRE